MLNCKQVAHQASDYVDRNVNGWQRFGMVVHLFICKHCRRFVQHVRITRDFMGKREHEVASEEEVKKVMKGIKKEG